ncbi:MAG: glycosyltransferase family 8 protein [bacterium]|jgi:lipopolysaccharide biosynthesis glycosyltransferase
MLTLDIAFTLNNAYAEPLRVLLTSIMASNSEHHLRFHVICSDFSDENRLKNQKIIDFFKNGSIDYKEIDPVMFEGMRLPDYRVFPLETYYQYLLVDVFKELDRILYLDVDIVVNGDLAPLWNTNLTGFYCAGVVDFKCDKNGHKYVLGMTDNHIYVNSGVLLHNLEKIRADKKAQELFADTFNLKDIIKYADQDVINYTYRGSIKEIDNIYNFGSSYVNRQFWKRRNAVIIHYLGRTKPWRKWNPLRLHEVYYRFEWQMKKILGEPFNLFTMAINRVLVARMRKKTQ